MSEPTQPSPEPQKPKPPAAPLLDTAADNASDQVDVSAMHSPIMREQQDPRDGYEPVPLWLITIFGLLIFWGGWYLATYSGGWRGDVFDDHPAALYSGQSAAPAKPVDPVELGKRIFLGNCAVCHQPDGKGAPPTYPPLAGSDWVNSDAGRLQRIVLHGFEGPVKINGQQYNNNMPAFAAKLKDEHIAAVLSFVRTNAAWGNSATAVTPQQVAATRQATQNRATPWTAAELEKITGP